MVISVTDDRPGIPDSSISAISILYLKKQEWELEITCWFSITDSNSNLVADKREERGFLQQTLNPKLPLYIFQVIWEWGCRYLECSPSYKWFIYTKPLGKQ